jgi:ABC-2 type transport system permease protein
MGFMKSAANVWALARREVQSYFASPVAYVVLALFLFLFGYFFSDYLFVFLERSMGRGGFGAPSEPLNLNQDLIRFVLLSASVVLLFLVPMLTMRAFAEEIRSGTIELLLTSPLTDFQIVLGKFLGALFLYAAMLLLTSPHMAILFYFGDPEWKPLLVGYLGLLLLGSAFISFGLVFSSLTRNQIVAGLLTFGTFLFLWLIEYAESWAGPASGVVTYLSVTKHLEELAKGVVDSRDVVYYLAFTGLGLFLSKQSLESLRWRG